MNNTSIWITGASRTGKTTRLVQEFSRWVKEKLKQRKSNYHDWQTATVLVLAANDDNRRDLADKLATSIQGSYPVISKTPLGFFSDEVILFWPLLFEKLNLKAQFPLRLRPENEQELATKLWREHNDQETILSFGGEYRFVRKILDLLQLAGASGTPTEDISKRLEQGFFTEGTIKFDPTFIGNLLLMWRQWCWERGLLTYGIIYELYWRYLLPDTNYQHHLINRYQAIFADDLDDYPAIARDLFTFLLEKKAIGIFTYNPYGQIRLGLNADPNYLADLATYCRVVRLDKEEYMGLSPQLENTIITLVTEINITKIKLPSTVQSIQTVSRADLLRKTGQIIIKAIKNQQIKPEEIAIIAPGLDEIARYSLMEILSHQGIPIEPLNEQRPLITSPLIRGLLTLLGLVYPDLGYLVEKEAVAEMLVILSYRVKEQILIPLIDPVRAGMISDYCYHLDLKQPHLMPVETFPRWDRLGHQATTAYQEIVEWIEQTKSQLKQRFSSPVLVLDEAIKNFFIGNNSYWSYEQLAVLRELIETAEHFWQVERRLKQYQAIPRLVTDSVAEFIQLLRQGTFTANPRPLATLGRKPKAITLATIFQYRSLRSCHRWHFWLDVSSSLWDQPGAANLFAAPLFLKEWSEEVWTPEKEAEEDQQRSLRIIKDLLTRVGEKIYLCHSDLSVKGNEQKGSLLSLVYSSDEVDEIFN